jgi:hypothetical protein
MKQIKITLFLFASMLLPTAGYAVQSTITEAEGLGCMGMDKSRKQTQQAAFADAKRNASEFALSYITSGTVVENMELKQDLVSAFSKSKVKVLSTLSKEWYKEEGLGDCYKVMIKAEVIPEKRLMPKKNNDDPMAPLNVKVWTNKKAYHETEKIKVYLKGNKPFHARVVYKDTSGNLIQILPNPYRQNNYFLGGIVYEIPTSKDKFDLEVSPPFGKESITLYASTEPVGEIELQSVKEAGVYIVNTSAKDIGIKSRGIKITGKKSASGYGQASAKKKSSSAEFVENDAKLSTER